jgi:hypothetical protein
MSNLQTFVPVIHNGYHSPCSLYHMPIYIDILQFLHALVLDSYPTFCVTRISLLRVPIRHIQEWGI